MDYRTKQCSTSGNSKLSAVHFISQISKTSFRFNIAGIKLDAFHFTALLWTGRQGLRIVEDAIAETYPSSLHVSHNTVVLRVGMHSLSQVQAEL